MSKRFGWFEDPDYWRPVSQNVLTGIILGSLAFSAAVFGGYVKTPARGFEVVFLGILPIMMALVIVIFDAIAFLQYRAGKEKDPQFGNWLTDFAVIGIFILTAISTFTGRNYL